LAPLAMHSSHSHGGQWGSRVYVTRCFQIIRINGKIIIIS